MAKQSNPDPSRTNPVETHPAGISNAVVEGATQGEQDRTQKPAPDARTVDPDRSRDLTGKHAPRGEQDEAPLGGGTVAFPAPSAQPSRTEKNSKD